MTSFEMSASVRMYKRVRVRVLPVCDGVEPALSDPTVNAMSQKETTKCTEQADETVDW